jgi:CarD family transcriptional regulator, regulator of rRNA transcription
VELAVGQVVVYGGHGPGRVVAREERGLGEARCEVIVLELAAEMRVTLPVLLARESLRPLANQVEMASVQRTLRTAAPDSELVWLKRHKETRAKVACGEPVALAEVVSDGARRYQGATARLSVSERELYLKARRLLADEIGLVRGTDSSEAEDWIADQLSQVDRS